MFSYVFCHQVIWEIFYNYLFATLYMKEQCKQFPLSKLCFFILVRSTVDHPHLLDLHNWSKYLFHIKLTFSSLGFSLLLALLATQYKKMVGIKINVIFFNFPLMQPSVVLHVLRKDNSFFSFSCLIFCSTT